MKTLKKLASALLALSLIMALTLPTQAAGDGKIIISSPSDAVSIVGKTFNAYKVFDLTFDGKDAYSYTPADAFKQFFKDNAQYTVGFFAELKDDATELDTFAKLLRAYINENGIVETASVTADAKTATIAGLDLGYYIVLDNGTVAGGDVISLCMLSTTDPNAEVTLKLEVPTVDKEVQEDSDKAWGETADYEIGQEVPFHFTTNVPEMRGYDYYKFVFHDDMTAGLTFIRDSVKVTIGKGENAKVLDANAYTVTNTGLSDDCDFELEIVLKNNGTNIYTPGDDIVVEFKALLNDEALIYTGKNTNDVHLEYSNNPYDSDDTAKTPDVEVEVYTYDFEIFKFTIDEETSTQVALAGAEFELRRGTEADEGVVKLVDLGLLDKVENEGVVKVQTYRLATEADTTTTTTVVSPESGKIDIRGLDADTYYLYETKAPAGYNAIEDPEEIVITRNASGENGSYQRLVAGIENKSGALFPETGGIGRTIFTVVGLSLTLGAVVVLIARRKVTGK